MKKSRVLGLTAAAVLGLGLAQARADCAAPAAPAAPARLELSSSAAESGVTMSVVPPVPQVEGVSAAFLQAVEQAAPTGGGGGGGDIHCYQNGGLWCCCAPLGGCYCVPSDPE